MIIVCNINKRKTKTKLNIKLDLNNAAFEDNMGREIARILENIVLNLENRPNLDKGEKILLDVNGNKVGILKIS